VGRIIYIPKKQGSVPAIIPDLWFYGANLYPYANGPYVLQSSDATEPVIYDEGTEYEMHTWTETKVYAHVYTPEWTIAYTGTHMEYPLHPEYNMVDESTDIKENGTARYSLWGGFIGTDTYYDNDTYTDTASLKLYEGEVLYRTVTIAVSLGQGTVTPSGAIQVEAGGSLLLQFAPGEGYEVQGLYVAGEPIPVTDDHYTIANIARDMIVGVAFDVIGSPFTLNWVSLLHFDGEDQSTAFTDERSRIWTPHDGASGQAKIITSDKVFGTASGTFGGYQGGYIECSDADYFNFGTRDFTFAFWIKLIEPAIDSHVFSKGTPGSTGYFRLYFSGDADTGWRAEFTGLSQQRYWGPTYNVWTHIALVKHGSEMAYFRNGTKYIWSGNFTTPLTNAYPFYIGGYPGCGRCLPHIDEFICLNGEALWTDSFTPPTGPYGG